MLLRSVGRGMRFSSAFRSNLDAHTTGGWALGPTGPAKGSRVGTDSTLLNLRLISCPSAYEKRDSFGYFSSKEK